MKRSISLALGLLLLGTIALAWADHSANKDWTESGRWLTPYTIPGYDGYGFVLPSGPEKR